MSRRIQTLILIALALLGVSFHFRLKKEPDRARIRDFATRNRANARWVGKIAPDFTLDLNDGTTFQLADHVGKEIIILNFFATWCLPCRSEMPELSRFVERSKGKPIRLIGIDGNEDPKLVESFVKEFGVTFPVGIDDETIMKRYRVEAYPTTVVIGVDGRVYLYEVAAITNADLTLKPSIEVNLRLLRAGAVTTKQAYLDAAADENYGDVSSPKESDDDESGKIVLAGRAQAIAETMDCACGCDDRLSECNCATGTRMKKKLLAGNFGDKTDAEIKTDLNAEFCMKGM